MSDSTANAAVDNTATSKPADTAANTNDASTTNTSTTTTTSTPADAKDTTTALGSDAKGTVTTPADWPEDWRARLAGQDAKKAERLNRFTSPAAVLESYLELEKKLSTSGAKKELSATPTAEELTAWRKDNGIPEKPEDYDLKFDNGLVIGDADKPFVDEYLKSAHAKNANPEVVKESVKWYLENRERQQQERHTKDNEVATATVSELKAEWGKEYERNINLIKGYFETDTISQKMLNARLADGTPLASDKEILKFLATRAIDYNPVATVTAGHSGNPAQGIAEEKATLEKLMGNRQSDYWKGPLSEQKQARYRELVDAELRLNKAKK